MKKVFFQILFFIFFANVLLGQSTFQKIYDYPESNQAYNVVALSDGGYAFLSILDETNGNRQVLLTKLDCDGNIEWSKEYGSSSSLNNVFCGIIESDNGEIVFAYNLGEFQDYNILVARVQLDGTAIWNKTFGGSRDDQGLDIIQTNDGNFVIAGKTNSWGTDISGLISRSDIYLFKIDGNGNMLWSQTYGNQGGTDDAYAVTEDTNGNLLITGRAFYEGFFRCFLIKTDNIGNEIFNKGFGKFDHTARGFDIIITSDGKYLMTGSTTIAKDNFSSFPDPFVIKTDSNGNLEFAKIYEVSTGDDNSDSGSTLVELPDGSFAIGVPTQSFSNQTVGLVPNKNAIYLIQEDGNLSGAKIFGEGGSIFNRLQPAQDDGFILSNHTNFYNNISGEFRTFLIKTDADFNSGCNEFDVSNDVVVSNQTWESFDISMTNLTGDQELNSSSISDFTYDGITTLCETAPLPPVADFSFQNACMNATVEFMDESQGNIISWNWNFSNSGSSLLENPDFNFSGSGPFEVELIVDDGCLLDTIAKDVVLDGISFNPFDTTICKGESFLFNGITFTENVDFVDTLQSYQGCDSVVILTLRVNPCGCELTFPNIFTPDDDGVNDTFGPYVECDQTIKNYRLFIFDRWGETVFDTFEYYKKWDGTLNGYPLPRDVFVYSVSYEVESGGETTFFSEINDLTLIR